MLNPARSIATIATAAILGLSTAAMTSAAPDKIYATPSKAVIKISNVRCPGSAELKIVVWSRTAGMVKVMLRQKGKGNLGTDVIVTTTKKNGLYKGVQTGIVQLARTGQDARYRIVATDGNAKTKSKWVSLKSCKLVT